MVKSVRGISVLVWAETRAKAKRKERVNAVFIKLLFSFFMKDVEVVRFSHWQLAFGANRKEFEANERMEGRVE
jgi:hypothetical protein